MKNLKLSMLAVAFILGIGGAVATNANSHRVAASGSDLYWYSVTGTSLNFDQLSDRASEKTTSGCSDAGMTHCAQGYTEDQLVDPNDPSLGVIPGQQSAFADVINKN